MPWHPNEVDMARRNMFRHGKMLRNAYILSNATERYRVEFAARMRLVDFTPADQRARADTTVCFSIDKAKAYVMQTYFYFYASDRDDVSFHAEDLLWA